MRLVDALSRLQRLDQPVVATGDAAVILGLGKAHAMISRIPFPARRAMVAERFTAWLSGVCP